MDTEDIKCPNCGSKNVEVKNLADILFYKCLCCRKLFVGKPSRRPKDEKKEEKL